MKITYANIDAVRYACLYFHYAKSTPVYNYAYNIYNDNNEWCGCILFGLGSCREMSNNLNCISGTLLELQRVALNGRQGHNQTSKAVAMGMNQVKKDAVCLKCLFSFADTEQKHIGIVYQATNWIYLGIRKGDYVFIKEGKKYHRRTINNRIKSAGMTNKEYRQIMGYCESAKVGDKHLYVYPYDKKIKKQLLKKRVQYPKRAD